jgi:hypothetical protein
VSWNSGAVVAQARKCIAELEGCLDTIATKESGTIAVSRACVAASNVERCLLRLRQINAKVLSDDYPRYEYERKSRRRGANEEHTKGSGKSSGRDAYSQTGRC